MSKKKILLIPPLLLPVPAVGGGAIETLITNLLDVNEIEQQCEFFVFSAYSEEAAKHHYQHATVIYFKNDVPMDNRFRLLWPLWVLYRFFMAVGNFVSFHLFGKKLRRLKKAEFYMCFLTRHIRPDIVVNEAGAREALLSFLTSFVGKDFCFEHIHYSKAEKLSVREIVPNSISISRYVRSCWVVHDIPGRNEVLYNGIALSQFQHRLSEEARQKERAALNIRDDETVVLFCGRLIPEKGVAQLLDAFDRLVDFPVKLLLVGSAAFSANKMTEFSQQILHRAQEMPNVLPMGYIPNDQLPIYYNCSDIQVIPSVWQEGAGLVAVEGMAFGLPLIATKSGGMVEYIDENAAILLPIDEALPQSLAQAVLALAQDPERRIQMSRAGRIRAERYSRENYYRNFIRIVCCESSKSSGDVPCL